MEGNISNKLCSLHWRPESDTHNINAQMLILTGPKTVYRPVASIYTRFLDQSISVSQSASRNNEGHVESFQPIKCMLFILICNLSFQSGYYIRYTVGVVVQGI